METKNRQEKYIAGDNPQNTDKKGNSPKDIVKNENSPQDFAEQTTPRGTLPATATSHLVTVEVSSLTQHP